MKLVIVAALSLSSIAAVYGQRITPDPRLTPGSVYRDITTRDVCSVGYSKRVRNVSITEKRFVYREYGVHYVPRTFEVDHLVPLELGGSNDVRNLWPEPYFPEWSAHVKDALEDALHKKVCRGSISLQDAQRAIATDWIGTYRLVFHTQEPRYVQRQIKERD